MHDYLYHIDCSIDCLKQKSGSQTKNLIKSKMKKSIIFASNYFDIWIFSDQ
jgi:hypothetical protein